MDFLIFFINIIIVLGADSYFGEETFIFFKQDSKFTSHRVKDNKVKRTDNTKY